MYELIKRVHGTKQGKGPLAGYYADLRAIWQEIDYYKDFYVDCVPDTKKYKAKLISFGHSTFCQVFYPEYDQAREQILGKNHFPHQCKHMHFCAK